MDGKGRATSWQGTEHLTGLALGIAFVLCVLPARAPHRASAQGLPTGELVATVIVPVLAPTLIFLHAGGQRRRDRKYRGTD